ncbi:MAG: WYL domain-containing protein, partial [Clostridia bacterium]|nr:WYL domain-containing protein [Clostridia bacterium]
TIERKAIKRNIMDLIDFGYDINYEETARSVKRPDGSEETTTILSDFYIERDFTDSELRLLIDSVMFSKHIPRAQCKELVSKLSKLSNKYFNSRIKFISTMPDDVPQNKQLFYNIEIIDEAIAHGKQITFEYNRFGSDKQMHPETDQDGNVKTFTANPYQIVAANGRYYLICNYDKYDDVANIRLDRITNIKCTVNRAKPQKQVPEISGGFNLPKHMAEHIYMFSGASAPVSFRAKKYLISDIIDWFGKDVRFSDETDDEITVTTTVNIKAMRIWALQYALHIKVLSPQTLADDVKSDIEKALANYN